MDTTTTTKTKTRTRKAAKIVDAEIIEVTPSRERTEVAKKVARLISDDGEINFGALTPTQKKRCGELTKNLVVSDPNSIMNFGSDSQNSLNNFSKKYLDGVKLAQCGKLGDQMLELRLKMNDVDIDGIRDTNFMSRLRHIPIRKHLAPSIEKRVAKYQDANKSIEECENKIKASRLVAMRDNNSLSVLFEEAKSDLARLEETIVAGKLKLQQMISELETLKESGTCENYEIADRENFINAFNQRLTDLLVQYFQTKMFLPTVRALQYNNMKLANNAASLMAVTVPQWRQNLAYAVFINNQRKSAELHKMVREKNRELAIANSEMIKENTRLIGEETNHLSTDIETLKITANNIIESLETQQKLKEESVKMCNEAQEQLLRLNEEVEQRVRSIGSIEGISRELLGHVE